MKLSKYIDHTALGADTKKERILSLCQEAKDADFASVCINSCWVKTAAEALRGTDVNVCTVVGFPLGAMSTAGKAFEAEQAVRDGAAEIDMVINIGWLKSHMYKEVEDDIRAVKKACGDKILKVIIETCLLEEDEKIMACELSAAAGADFVKTSTGFSKAGAKVEDVELMKRTIPSHMKVKAAGGIRSYETAMKMIEAGASRLGTSSGTAIIDGAKSDAAN